MNFLMRKARIFFRIILIALVFWGCQEEVLPDPDIVYNPIDLDEFSTNLKGFNLLGKFDVNWSNRGFTEEDFIMINDLGFNFARLPLDYLTFTAPGDWNTFLESEMEEIDQAIRWGEEFGVHICINFHRAPGYSVNQSTVPSSQQRDLWQDAAVQEVFLKHWEYFAKRYKDISINRLSFNLINEPANVKESTYLNLMLKAVENIHRINSDRVIFVDGYNWARDIIPELQGAPNVIQSIHTYDPFNLTHYKANWVEGSDTWPVPVWPMVDVSSYLYGSWKPEYQSALVLEGDFVKATEVIVNVKQVSLESTLQIMLDDQVIYTKTFLCGPEKGEDWTEIILTQWGYQNISNKDYSVLLPDDGTKLSIANASGDWMTYNSITLKSGIEEMKIIPGNNAWGSTQGTYLITGEGEITDEEGNSLILNDLHEKLEFARSYDIPVMVQEFGVHNQTPHDVTLAFLSDLVPVFRQYDIGYALWNLEGSLGIINSGRDDVQYESYRGKLLDSQMLDILQGNNNSRYFPRLKSF